MCNFVEYKGKKIVYKRYASLFFVCLVAADDNELVVLETIHSYVEALDQLFNNVSLEHIVHTGSMRLNETLKVSSIPRTPSVPIKGALVGRTGRILLSSEIRDLEWSFCACLESIRLSALRETLPVVIPRRAPAPVRSDQGGSR